ncbi:MAG: trypsin-like peptidase domain-containing protein [Planctomycetota bacterium]
MSGNEPRFGSASSADHASPFHATAPIATQSVFIMPCVRLALGITLNCLALIWGSCLQQARAQEVAPEPSLGRVAREAQQRVVKVYGAGGLAGLEEYQSGFLVSPSGHVATVWSYVLDVDPIVVLDDGRRFEAEIVGFEPALELAVLKVEADGLPFYSLPADDQAGWGDPVLAVSNLFNIAVGNEPASVMRGRIATKTRLDARRGTFQTPYRGSVYLLDLVANNPGAAGGALVDRRGTFVAMLGKELRDSQTGSWLNYAIPSSAIRQTVGDIIAGRKTLPQVIEDTKLALDQAHDVATLGLVMVPDVLETTPAFVDAVPSATAAQRAGLQADDLVLLVNGVRTASQRALREQLRRIDRRDDVTLLIQRDNEIKELVLRP